MPAFVYFPVSKFPTCERNRIGKISRCEHLRASSIAKTTFLQGKSNRFANYSTTEQQFFSITGKFHPQCTLSKEVTSPTNDKLSAQLGGFHLKSGSVVEAWVNGALRFAFCDSVYDKGIFARFILLESDNTFSETVRISFGEIINIWDDTILPTGADAAVQLAKDVDRGTQFVKHAAPRTLDLKNVYTTLQSFSKKDPRGAQSSFQISSSLFPMRTKGTRERLATVTVATAILLSTDDIHFKRAGPGRGWRALPSSIAISRSRLAFINICKGILESSESKNKATVWERDQLEILRDIEIVAASGTNPKGTSAIILRDLGYESTDEGAARFLLDIEYWATGSVEKNGVSSIRQNTPDNVLDTNSVDGSVTKDAEKGEQASGKDTTGLNRTKVTDWTFPPELLDEARELRRVSREKRFAMQEKQIAEMDGERRIFGSLDGQDMRIYCIDEKNTRFLDDAMSIQFIPNTSIVRIATHITDVDEVVRSSSPIDNLAKERGQSLYLPLKPLHMLPAAAMDAASFSTSYPAYAITVLIDFDCNEDIITNWEVFASIIPPVTRLSYGQFDAALENDSKRANLKEDECRDLREIARIAPLLADKLDQRSARRRQRVGGSRLDTNDTLSDENGGFKTIAGVRLIKRTDKSSPGRSLKVAQVLDFQTTGSHSAVANMLTSASALFRQFALENRVSLPENRGASSYMTRCGTAPLRRYSDLAIQRQIKCVLFGRQPAGRRRMDELRIWLTKRHAAGERTLAEKRKGALYDSLSSHCAQQILASGTEFATVEGLVRNVSVTRKRVIRVVVALDRTGLSTTAAISDEIHQRILAMTKELPSSSSDDSESEESTRVIREKLFMCAREKFTSSTKVRVQISNVDTSQFNIDASIVQIIN